MHKRTIVVFTTPAYGHIYSMLHLLRLLSDSGFTVICWSVEAFRESLEQNGCTYRPYPIDWDQVDLSDGKRILKLYRLLLTYTWEMQPVLADATVREQGFCIVYDSLALWGRMVAETLRLPSASFYSILSVDRFGSAAFFAYAKHFSAGFLRHVTELPDIYRYRKKLRRQNGASNLGLLAALMNRGDVNLMNYSRIFQPGGGSFGTNYLFLGPGACYRLTEPAKEPPYPNENLIYVSLGTVFCQNHDFWLAVLEQFGNTRYSVLIAGGFSSDGTSPLGQDLLPPNITVRPFVNQREVLERAKLFITSGGLNSLHEALLYGVPCLGIPQQGEQRMNLNRMEALGLGRILRNTKQMYAEAEKMIADGSLWERPLRTSLKELTADRTGDALEVFKRWARQEEI